MVLPVLVQLVCFGFYSILDLHRYPWCIRLDGIPSSWKVVEKLIKITRLINDHRLPSPRQHRLLFTVYRLPFFHHLPFFYRSLFTVYRLPILFTDHYPPITIFLPFTVYRSPFFHRSPITEHRLPFFHRLPITIYRLPFLHRIPITYQLLTHTSNC